MRTVLQNRLYCFCYRISKTKTQKNSPKFKKIMHGLMKFWSYPFFFYEHIMGQRGFDPMGTQKRPASQQDAGRRLRFFLLVSGNTFRCKPWLTGRRVAACPATMAAPVPPRQSRYAPRRRKPGKAWVPVRASVCPSSRPPPYTATRLAMNCAAVWHSLTVTSVAFRPSSSVT